MPISEYNRDMARAATTSDVFNAIAEPQRREILVLLRAGERPVTELAQELGMTQPGASKHLRVLREVGLVRDRKAGKQRLYGLDARGLRPVTSGPAGSSGSGARASTGWTRTCRTSSRQGRRSS
jgi:DNA-binding transcriptional ArsR family regulator